MNNKVIISIWEGTATINASPQGTNIEIRDHDTLDGISEILIMYSDEDNVVSGEKKTISPELNTFEEFEIINYSINPINVTKDYIEKIIGRKIEGEAELRKIRNYLENELTESLKEKLKKYE